MTKDEITERTVFFLGAGATKADFTDAPLMDDLLHLVIEDETCPGQLSNFLVSLYGRASVRRGRKPEHRPRVDDVFTLIDASLSGRAPALPDYPRERLLDIRWLLVAGIASQLNARLLGATGQSATGLARAAQKAHATVISTNYDIIMDNALLSGSNINYGVSVRGVLQDGPRPDELAVRQDEARWLTLIPDDRRIRRGPVPLLKLHGSLNWLYCPRCDELDIFLEHKGTLRVLHDPRLGRCCSSRCTGRYEPLIVGPSLEQRYDNRVLRETWALADEKLEDAEELIIIGYSMPPSDFLIRAMLTRHFARRSAAVLVVTKEGTDKRTARENRTNFRRLFAKCEFAVSGFESFVESIQ